MAMKYHGGIKPVPITEAQTYQFEQMDVDYEKLRNADVTINVVDHHNRTIGARKIYNVAHEHKVFVRNVQDENRIIRRDFPNMVLTEPPFGTLPAKNKLEALKPLMLEENVGKKLHQLKGLERGTPLWEAVSAFQYVYLDCQKTIEAGRGLCRNHHSPAYGDSIAAADEVLHAMTDAARETRTHVELLETLTSVGLCPLEMVPHIVELYLCHDAGIVSGAVIKTFKTPEGAQALFVSPNGVVPLTSSAQPYNGDVVQLAVITALGVVMDGTSSTSDAHFSQLVMDVFHHLCVLGLPELQPAGTLAPPILLAHGYPQPLFAGVVESWCHQHWRQLPAILAAVHWDKPRSMAFRNAAIPDQDVHRIPRGVSLTTPMEDDSGEFRLPLEPAFSTFAPDPLGNTVSTGSYGRAQDNAAAAYFAQDTQDTYMSDVLPAGLSDATAMDVANIFDTLGAPDQEVDLLKALGKKPASAFRPSVYAKLLDMCTTPTTEFDVSRFLESSAFSPCTPNVYRPQQMAAMTTLQGRNLRSRRFDGASGSASNPIDLTIVPPEWNPSR